MGKYKVARLQYRDAMNQSYVLVLHLAFYQPEINCHCEFVKLTFQWINEHILMQIIFIKLFLHSVPTSCMRLLCQ